MKQQKVGLVTYYQNNLGGCLQAYALQQTIIKQGYSCKIIRYNIAADQKSTPLSKKLRHLLHLRQTMQNRQFCRILASFNQSAEAFDRFRENHLVFSENEDKKAVEYYQMDLPYDAVVCGSDQIWNPELTDFCSPIYFLDFVPDGIPKIAYAPSIAVSHIQEKYQEDFIRFVERFRFVSVREPEGTEIVNTLTSKQAVTVLDPTLLLEASDYESILAPAASDEDYIFCYVFGDGDHIRQAKEELKQKTGLKIKTIPYQPGEFYSQDEKIADAGPSEFLSLIKNAKYVITDSFHATVFSVNFGIPFFTLIRQHGNQKANMSSRITGILGQLGLEDRIIKAGEELPVNKTIDFAVAHEKLKHLRKDSLTYLQTALRESLPKV